MSTGACLCGHVRYELDVELGPSVNCHCRYCRRAHGAAFATVSWVPRAALHFTSGEDAIREYRRAGGIRAFCERCGTRLFNALVDGPEFVALVVSSLDEGPEQHPVMHINTESKAPWYDILDDLPQHETLPPEMQRAIDRARR